MIRRRLGSTLAILTLAVALLTSCGTLASTSTPTPAPTPTPTPLPPPVDVTVVYTSDTVGYTDPCG